MIGESVLRWRLSHPLPGMVDGKICNKMSAVSSLLIRSQFSCRDLTCYWRSSSVIKLYPQSQWYLQPSLWQNYGKFTNSVFESHLFYSQPFCFWYIKKITHKDFYDVKEMVINITWGLHLCGRQSGPIRGQLLVTWSPLLANEGWCEAGGEML